MENSLTGKVCIVTGAAGGIGAATATELVRRGASVVLADVDAERAEAQARTLDDGRAVGIGIDVRSEDQVRAMIEFAVSTFGGLDVLHNNAADTQASVSDDQLTEMPAEIWDVTMEVNVRGAMFGAKYAIPRMLERGGGVIINTSSGAGTLAEPVRPAYGVSKAALESLTRSIAVQYGKQGIRCVGVAPGITMGQPSRDAIGQTGWYQMMERHHLTPDLGTPEDIAKLVAYLVSDDARFITGTTVAIDGGITASVPYTHEMRGRGTGIF